MKKAIVTFVSLIAFAGCASTQFDPKVDMADVMKSAVCIEQAVYCTQQAAKFRDAKDWDVVAQAWESLDKCIDQLADLGCIEQAKELREKFEAAKNEGSN